MSLSSAPPPRVRDTAVDLLEQKSFDSLDVGKKVHLDNADCRFEGIDLVGRSLELFVKDHHVCTLYQNSQGNLDNFTYTLALNDRPEVLMPCPKSGSMPFQYTFRASDFEIGLTDEEKTIFSDVCFELFLQHDQSINFVHNVSDFLPSWPLSYRVTELYGGAFEESGERFLDIQQIQPGDSGVLRAWMEGCQLYMCSDMTLGKGRYRIANGDNIGFNRTVRRFALGDGLGGHGNDHLASHKGVQQVLRNNKRLDISISDAGIAMHWYNHYLEQPQYDLYDPRQVQSFADSTLIAGELVGNRLSVCNIGDGRWRFLRNGKVLFKSLELGSARGQLIAMGILEDKESYELAETSPYYTSVSPLLGTIGYSRRSWKAPLFQDDGQKVGYRTVNIFPEIVNLYLEQGDVFLGFSDGYDALQDFEIEEIIQQWDGKDADELGKMLKERASQTNIAGEYDRVFKTGTVKLRAPEDHGSMMIVVKE